jgi:hypothetical protein
MVSLAAVDLTPYATASYEHQSNPFNLSGDSQSTARFADSLLLLRAGLDARIGSPRQALVAVAEIRRFDYRDLVFLGRTEEMLDGSYQWALTSLVDGSVGYLHEHRMVPFDELAGSREQLMETEDAGAASLNLSSRNGWRLESRVKARDLASPRPGVAGLTLRETSIHEAVRRQLKTLSVGLDGEYLSGSYKGAAQPLTPHYRQTSVLLAGERRIAGFTSFEFGVGHTRRNDSAGADVSAFSGLLSYKRELTGKTAVEASLTRAVNSYLTTAGSEIDTGLALQIAWQPTAKLQVASAFKMIHSTFPGQRFDSESSRRDRYRIVTLDIRCQVFYWLAIHPYARHALRSSSVPTLGFNANAIGLELVFKESK